MSFTSQKFAVEFIEKGGVTVEWQWLLMSFNVVNYCSWLWILMSFNVSNSNFSYSSITVLDFSFNYSFANGHGRCSKLKILRASFNSITGSLPDDIHRVSTLQQLFLQYHWGFGCSQQVQGSCLSNPSKNFNHKSQFG